MILHTCRNDFSPREKIKNQDVLLQLGLLHRIIAYNILPKKGYYDEVIFMDMCLIDCMIKNRLINLPYIIIQNIIMAHDQKQKPLPYGQALTFIFEHCSILLISTDSKSYLQAMEINNLTLTKMKFLLNEEGVWVAKIQVGTYVEEEHDEEELHVSGDDEFVNMFKKPLITLFFFEDAGTNS